MNLYVVLGKKITRPPNRPHRIKSSREEAMDFFFNPRNEETSDCSLSEQDFQKCPFLRNIDKPTNFSFASLDFTGQLKGAKGPIFEDGPNFDLAFKFFHGKDGVVPLSGKSRVSAENLDNQSAPQFNPLAANAASISMSAFGPGGPFSFHSFLSKIQKKTPDSSRKKENSSKSNSKKHEAMGNEWLETGNCPIAKSYRAASRVLPLVATSLQLPPGMKLKCPPAVVAARAALARTALVKNLRPQPLPSKMLVIGALGMSVNIPLGVWREHTEKFSPSWFAAVHAAVPFIAMLRKSVVMPQSAMILTIAISIAGQAIGSRAERLRLKDKAEKAKPVAEASTTSSPIAGGHCGKREIMWDPLPKKVGKMTSSPASVCF